jgi:hypothetical protein
LFPNFNFLFKRRQIFLTEIFLLLLLELGLILTLINFQLTISKDPIYLQYIIDALLLKILPPSQFAMLQLWHFPCYLSLNGNRLTSFLTFSLSGKNRTQKPLIFQVQHPLNHKKGYFRKFSNAFHFFENGPEIILILLIFNINVKIIF